MLVTVQQLAIIIAISSHSYSFISIFFVEDWRGENWTDDRFNSDAATFTYTFRGHFQNTTFAMGCKNKRSTPQFLVACLALAICLLVTSGGEAINVADTFCSVVEETLKINGTTIRQDSFHLCMDVKSLNWRRDDKVPGSNMAISQVFTHSDNTVYKIYYDANRKAVNCTTFKPSSPTTENDLPFRFAQVDDQATLNGTTKINGVLALRYRHLRPAKRVGPGLLPAEDMNWFISKSVVGAAQDLLETHCYEDLPQGGQSDGSRNFQSRYSRNVPEDTFRVQKSLSCKPAKMMSYREKAVWRSILHHPILMHKQNGEVHTSIITLHKI